MKVNSIIFAVLAVAVGLGITYLFPSRSEPVKDVKLPDKFSELALEGRKNFKANCIVCHGENGKGTSNGPPLIHIIYEPNHHSDKSFYLAVSNGVRRHHWKFGDMPPLNRVTEDQVTSIIRYIREIQRANGIF